jgi:hypothetical protein
MKKVITILLTFVLFMPVSVCATTDSASAKIVILDDGNYFETVIEDDVTDYQNASATLKASSTTTKSKTTYFKNSSGNILWYVKVTGTFTYGNGSAKCTKSICTAESKSKAWKVSNKASSKTGNCASASATGTHYINGASAETYTRTVTLKCSSTGKFS